MEPALATAVPADSHLPDDVAPGIAAELVVELLDAHPEIVGSVRSVPMTVGEDTHAPVVRPIARTVVGPAVPPIAVGIVIFALPYHLRMHATL